MNTILKRWGLPLLFSFANIAAVRVANDVTRNEFYWQVHDAEFMLKDVGMTIVGSFIVVWLLRRWARRCFEHKYNHLVEYSVVVLPQPIGCFLIMWAERLSMGMELQFSHVGVPVVVLMLLSALFYTVLRNEFTEKENEAQRLQLEKVRNDQLQTELKYLKAQYHPHFLFNVLNTIYFQIDEENEAPRHTIEQLSELLRYQLYHDGEKVTLATEAHHLEQYVALCSTRASKRLKLQKQIDIAGHETTKLYPLLLIPLVENAFKYVGGEYKMSIRLGVRTTETGREMVFEVENSVPDAETEHASQRKKTGIGLENLKRRLALLYDGRHSLSTSKKAALQGGNVFYAELKIKL